jgi:acyl-CoA synthetase (AMP-forming)/AMP-acid ligase II
MLSTKGLYSIAQTVRLRAKELGDDTLFYFEDQTTTFSEYHSLSSQTAKGLLSEGIQVADLN